MVQDVDDLVDVENVVGLDVVEQQGKHKIPSESSSEIGYHLLIIW